MKLRPLYNRLVIKRDSDPKVSEGGLILVTADTNDRNQLKPEGTVLAVGHDVSVAVGDHVVFRKMAGTEVKVDGEELLVMTEDDVIAVVS